MSKKSTRYIPALTASWSKSDYGNHWRFKSRIVWIDTETPSDDCDLGDMHHNFPYRADEKLSDMECFQFTGSLTEDATSSHYDPSWDTYDLTFHNIARMAKASSRISKAMEKMKSERGYSIDMADEFGRIASALGISHFLVHLDDVRREQCGWKYRVQTTIGDIVQIIRCHISDLKYQYEQSHASPEVASV